MGVDVNHYIGVFAKVNNVFRTVEKVKVHQVCIKCPSFRNTVGNGPKMEFCPYCGNALDTVEEKYTEKKHVNLNEVITDDYNDESLMGWHCYGNDGKEFYVLISNLTAVDEELKSILIDNYSNSEAINLAGLDHDALIARFKEIFKVQLGRLEDAGYPYEVMYGYVNYYN